jgi:RnfABCDGE-type electron transport complex G subunit
VRDILRLSLTLALVGIISASLLTGIHGVTAPIIAERQETEYRQALESYFPGFESFETEQIDDDSFDLIYDGDGELIGVMATIRQQGYEGDITYNLAIDGEGTIIGVIVVSHSETPGIGDVITTDSFQEQFIGKSFEDPITAGDDVDIVSGATISTAAMINSIRAAVAIVAENFLGHEAAVIDISEVPDGTYEGSAPGLAGPIVVEVEVAGGEIVSITVLEHNETPTYFIEAYPLIPDQIIAEQSFDVDTRTGATISAVGIVEAVRNALAGALGMDNGAEEVPEPVEVDISGVPDGTYQGSAPGLNGPVVVEVEVSGGEIISIAVLEHEETPEYFIQSHPLTADRIIEEQSFDIDTRTGATITANAIVNAVLDALSGAGEGNGGEDS